MGATARRLADYRDILALPPHVTGEIIAGELHASPRARAAHAFAIGGMTASVFGRGGTGGDRPDDWWILPEVELHLDGHVLVPDLAGWRVSTLPEFPDVAAVNVRPDWVCEVLSPSNFRWDRFRKMPLYAQLGVGHAWIVDPDQQSVEVMRNHLGQWLWVASHTGGGEASLEPFDSAPLEVGRWWAPKKAVAP